MAIESIPGTPYHRLGRTERHRAWRPIVGTVLVVGLVILATTLLSVLGYLGALAAGRPKDQSGLIQLGDIGELGLLLACIACAIPATMLAARWVQRRPSGSLSSVTGRLRLRWMGLCALVATPTVAAILTGGAGLALATGHTWAEILDSGWVGWSAFLAPFAVLLLVPLQAAGEEYFFRGWLLQAIGSFGAHAGRVMAWLAVGIQAVAFSAAHGFGTPWGFADLVVLGVAIGWLTIRTGGLEAAIAFHAVNNAFALLISAALGQLSSAETAADLPWEFALVDMVLVVLYAVVVARLARRRGLTTVRPPRPGRVSPGHPPLTPPRGTTTYGIRPDAPRCRAGTTPHRG